MSTPPLRGIRVTRAEETGSSWGRHIKAYRGTIERYRGCARLEPIERAIMATPVQTVVGLGVKARHAAYVISEYWAEPLEKADWDRRTVRLLIDAVFGVAGRPLA